MRNLALSLTMVLVLTAFVCISGCAHCCKTAKAQPAASQNTKK